MRCIFCKSDSSQSKSVEHIVPESLGNKSHILPRGVVCDKCNNYFALKIEKKALEQIYFHAMRNRNQIENKKNRIPGHPAFIGNPLKSEIELFIGENNQIHAVVESKNILKDIMEGKANRLFIPFPQEPMNNNIILSRLLAKIAIEALAERVMKVDNWREDFVKHEGLDPLRRYARFEEGVRLWPYHQRRIYPEDNMIIEEEGGVARRLQVMHEYDILFPDPPVKRNESYDFPYSFFVCAIMGIEYTINLTYAGLERYEQWLVDNKNNSILTMEKKNYNQFDI